MDKLENVWSVFQNLDEFVYASDIETNELVYLNRKAMDTFGLKSIEESATKCCKVQISLVRCVPTINSPWGTMWNGATTTTCSTDI